MVDKKSYQLQVAGPEKIIRSKTTFCRPRDKAVLDILENTLAACPAHEPPHQFFA